MVTVLVTSTKLSYMEHGWYWYFPGNSGPLSLAIPPWVGEMSIGDGFIHHWGRNGEFCVVVCPATRTADILLKALAVKLSPPSGRHGLYAA